MAFSPFTKEDFKLMGQVTSDRIPEKLDNKIRELRISLGQFPEFKLDYFKKHIVRRPMRGEKGEVFRSPKSYTKHWVIYIVGGDQDQVQLNIGMGLDYIRVGLAFQIGRMVKPKIPAFQVLQTFLGVRPPLPFRDALYKCIEKKGFEIQGFDSKNVDEIINHLETYVISPDKGAIFIFIGKLWDVREAITKTATDFRDVFLKLMPFYEELILAGGRYEFHPPD